MKVETTLPLEKEARILQYVIQLLFTQNFLQTNPLKFPQIVRNDLKVLFKPLLHALIGEIQPQLA